MKRSDPLINIAGPDSNVQASMRSDELDYELALERIATDPAEPRDAARLMVIHRRDGRIEHRRVRDLPTLLDRGDLMVLNRTSVLPAMLHGRRKATGGKVGLLYLESPEPLIWAVLIEARGKLEAGQRIVLDGESAPGPELELLKRIEAGIWHARLHASDPTPVILQRLGQTPLPPYIRKARRALGRAETSAADAERYNTIYASEAGSVAAPTAGLHLSGPLLKRLVGAGIERAELTLHIGVGTFAPIRTETVEAHSIHREWLSIPSPCLEQIERSRRAGGRIIPVGTSTVRALESLPTGRAGGDGPFTIWTDLLISPGFEFQWTDGLLTNFHLPRSSLLALVAALPGVGIGRIKRHYRIAIDQKYRFYSYGDAMLIL